MWPAWKVRESGGASGTTSWFHVLLAFPDGARVDALAVVNEGRVSIEDVTAQPALSLADLTVLSDWIQGPLSEACGVPAGEGCAGSGAGAGGGAREEPVADANVDPVVPADAETDTGGESVTGGAGGESDTGGAGGADGSGEGSGAGGGDRRTGVGAEPDPGPPVPGHGRSSWPRGVEGSRLVAREYRAAQGEGADPVLAVMNATGHSRRRALRLIAQARDAGFLTPRHIRR
ncbi:DUF6214 family protein [Streptomyces sp. NPDC015171]|uniref:DUF6214 family protein n=1 Tax=Streptomyces sp. NPDC015171 TaxID=3364945 RepID=UPI0036F81EA9